MHALDGDRIEIAQRQPCVDTPRRLAGAKPPVRTLAIELGVALTRRWRHGLAKRFGDLIDAVQAAKTWARHSALLQRLSLYAQLLGDVGETDKIWTHFTQHCASRQLFHERTRCVQNDAFGIVALRHYLHAQQAANTRPDQWIVETRIKNRVRDGIRVEISLRHGEKKLELEFPRHRRHPLVDREKRQQPASPDRSLHPCIDEMCLNLYLVNRQGSISPRSETSCKVFCGLTLWTALRRRKTQGADEDCDERRMVETLGPHSRKDARKDARKSARLSDSPDRTRRRNVEAHLRGLADQIAQPHLRRSADLNAAIRRPVDELNMRGYGASRADLFATIDRLNLQPLPPAPYAFARWKRARVAPDYHVEVDSSWYSVPFGLIRQEVDVRICGAVVEILHKGQRVASHPRRPGRRSHVTAPEHMPSAHRRYTEWTPARMLAQASKISRSVAAFCEAVMADRSHPEQGFRICLGVLAPAISYDPLRLDAACRRGLSIRPVASIRSILNTGLDRAFLEEHVRNVITPIAQLLRTHRREYTIRRRRHLALQSAEPDAGFAFWDEFGNRRATTDDHNPLAALHRFDKLKEIGLGVTNGDMHGALAGYGEIE